MSNRTPWTVVVVPFFFLTILLSSKSALSQIINPGHAGKINSGAGAVPYISQPFASVVSGNFAYVLSYGANTLEIIDITNPAAPSHKSVMTLQGLSNTLFLSGQYVYVGIYGGTATGGMEIIDVSDPANPVHVGGIIDGEGGADLNNPASIHVVGNFAYIVNINGSSMEILDVSNPAAPKHKSTLTNGTGGAVLTTPFSIYVSGNYAYIVGDGNTLEIVDVSDPALPVHKGKIADGAGGAKLKWARSVYVSGNYAYVVEQFHGALEIVDVTNPALPVHKGAITDGGGVAPFIAGFNGGSNAIDIVGDYAYISAGFYDALEIVDISNPGAPVHKGSIMNDDNGAKLGGPVSVDVVGNYAYITSIVSDAFEVVDISDPASPSHMGALSSGTGGAPLAGAGDVFVVGDYAYVAATGSNALTIVDISKPTAPVVKGSLKDGNGNAPFLVTPTSVSVAGNYAYVINVGGVLEIVDITNPAAPIHKGSIHDGGGTAPYLGSSFRGFVAGNYVYVVSRTYNALEILDVTDPAKPVHKGSLVHGAGGAVLNQPTGVFVSGNYAYVASRNSNALEIVDVTNPAAPVHKGKIVDGGGVAPFLAGPVSVFVSGNHAYVASSISNAVEIIDVTNPALPVHKGSIKDGGGTQPYLFNATDIWLSGNYAYVTSQGVGKNGLEIIDVSNPANPVHYAAVRDHAGGADLRTPQGIYVSGNYVYIASSASNALEIIYKYSPRVSSFSPTTGPVGTPVTLSGDNFSTLISVDFNGAQASLSGQVTLNSAVVNVPVGATIGKISVAQNGTPQPNTTNFIVTPTALEAFDIQQNEFVARWSDVKAVNYFVDVSTDNFTTFVGNYNNLTVGTASLSVTGLASGKAYQYRVRSTDGAASSSNSNTIVVLTPPATPVALPAKSVTQTGFTASWNSIPGSTGYYIDIAQDPEFTRLLGSYSNLYIPGIADTTQIVSGLNPFTRYYYRVRSANLTGSSPSSNSITVQTSDTTAPVIGAFTPSNPPTITGGNTPTFNAIVTDNVAIDSVKIFYRGISHSNFKSVSMQGPGGTGGIYTIIVQTSWYDSLGLEYYFMAKDAAGNKTVTAPAYAQLVTSSISLPQLPVGSGPGDYRLISFPYLLRTDNKVTTVYNGVPWDDNSKAAIWWWDPTMNNNTGAYQQFGQESGIKTVDPGKGYWVLTTTAATPQLSDVAAPTYNRANLFTMTLKPRWNSIGNPYPVPISWDDVIEFNQRVNPTALFSQLTVYDGTAYTIATGNTFMKAFEGGFVNNLGASDVTIQIPFPDQSNSSGRVTSSEPDISEEMWSIFINAEQSGFTNKLGGFGMHPLAQQGKDRYDNFNPPRFLQMPEIDFSNADHSADVFAKDMVALQDEYTWEFTTAGITGEPMKITWNNDITSSSGKQLFLLDELRLTVIDMTASDSYEFILTGESHFRIFYGLDVRRKISTREVRVVSPYPNPVTAGSKATFSVSLPDKNQSYSVSIQVFNAQGLVVESGNQSLAAGIHQLEFQVDGQSGMYVYRLLIASGSSSQIYAGKIIKQ